MSHYMRVHIDNTQGKCVTSSEMTTEQSPCVECGRTETMILTVGDLPPICQECATLLMHAVRFIEAAP